MRDAMTLTKVEREDLAKAEAKVTEAEIAVGRIVGQIQALQAGKTVMKEFTRPDGRSMFRKLMDPQAKAKEAAELPELKQDLLAARSILETAHRKRNRVLAAINAARMARRKAAKGKAQPEARAGQEPRRLVVEHGTPRAKGRRLMSLLGAHKTMTTGVSPGVTPSALLVTTGLGQKLSLDLGAQVILVALGTNPRAALEAIRHDLDSILNEREAA